MNTAIFLGGLVSFVVLLLWCFRDHLVDKEYIRLIKQRRHLENALQMTPESQVDVRKGLEDRIKDIDLEISLHEVDG